MNKCTIKVDKIRSYQTLLYKNGRMTFPKPIYKVYKQQLHVGMSVLKKISNNSPICVKMALNVKGGYEPDKHRVKLKKTGNTSKVFSNKDDAIAYLDETKHDYEFIGSEIKYGSVPDFDNAMKPILDYLEEMGIISNDRNIVSMNLSKTFNNVEETIDIELFEMNENSEGVVSFD